MSALCGMVPFANPNRPDQGYRVIVTQFIHTGYQLRYVTLPNIVKS